MPLCEEICQYKVMPDGANKEWVLDSHNCSTPPSYCFCSELLAFDNAYDLAQILPSGAIMKIKCGAPEIENPVQCFECTGYCTWKIVLQEDPFFELVWEKDYTSCAAEPCSPYDCTCPEPNIVLNQGYFTFLNLDEFEDFTFFTSCRWTNL